jgi:cellulose synthase/poly-beta-1,6-N-acetylglucosamine synthase-like glycosyltransferase
MGLEALLRISVLLALAYLATVAAVAIVAALNAGGRRDDAGDEHEALAASRFTIPVSIIVRMSNRASSITRTLAALLELNYPEFEVIVVVDGAPHTSLEELTREWQLEAREFFYRKVIDTGEVRRIYRSGRDSRLMVIDKAAAGYSDALNCGVNVARYRYVMPIDPEVTFGRDALLRVMTAALRDPAHVIGASNHVEQGVVGDWVGDGVRVVPGLTGLFERLASARALMDSRLAWRHLGNSFGPAGSINVWRRDAVIKAQGFSAAASDPQLDLMLKLQTRGIEGVGRFDRSVDVFGHVGPRSLGGALRVTGRRQRATLEILSALVRGRARGVDGKALAYFLACEIATPFAQLWIVGATLAGAGLGWFSWTSLFLAIVLLSFGNAAVSTAALLLRGSSTGAPDEAALKRLLAAGTLEFVLYRPLLAGARLAAAISFVVP